MGKAIIQEEAWYEVVNAFRCEIFSLNKVVDDHIAVDDGENQRQEEQEAEKDEVRGDGLVEAFLYLRYTCIKRAPFSPETGQRIQALCTSTLVLVP